MPTYTVKWRDANGGEHTHAGVGTRTMQRYVDALTSYSLNTIEVMTLVSVTLDEA